MILTGKQIHAYRNDGYLLVPDLFSAKAIALLRDEVPKLVAEDRESIIREVDGKTVRSILNPHLYNDLFDRLCRHEKLIEPVMQLVGSQVYIFQSILNVKRAFDGSQWQWHQDYPTYKIDDKMAEPRAVNALIFVDDVTEFNGPIMMVPGSQNHETEIPDVDTSVTTFPHGRYPDVEWVKPVMAMNGIVAPKGRRGSVVFMDLLTVHGSGPNMSPWHRSVLSLTLNSVENKATGTVRGAAVCHDYTPIDPLPLGAILEAARK
jgi:ectoine hydroxylase